MDCVVAVGPLGQARDCLGDNEHIVVHDPKPLGSQLIGALNAGREAAGAACVFKLWGVDHAICASFGIRLVTVAPKGKAALVEFRHHLFGGGGVLVIHDDDAPGGIVKRGD